MSSILTTTLKKYFTWTVTIEPFVSEDKFNRPTYGAAVTYKAKIERAERETRADDQHVVRSRRLIYLLTTNTGITTKDRLTVPAALEPLFEARNPKIIDVRSVTKLGPNGGVHQMVLET
jgi:hypothetical protein